MFLPIFISLFSAVLVVFFALFPIRVSALHRKKKKRGKIQEYEIELYDDEEL